MCWTVPGLVGTHLKQQGKKLDLGRSWLTGSRNGRNTKKLVGNAVFTSNIILLHRSSDFSATALMMNANGHTGAVLSQRL